ncbi:MAG: hypothetical protein DYG89_15915 [Caldilinea sp. CFX5]|nr:hypothetical protein [Caldilinea sp. CFX5]
MKQKTYLFRLTVAITRSWVQRCRRWLPLLSILIACGSTLPLLAADDATNGAILPNDPDYQRGEQYGLDLINVQTAWRYTHGDPRVVVALIDTGIDFDHPELADHIHPDARTFYLQGPPRDENGHGTLAAGIIAAAANNGRGTAGIASNVQILPIKVSPGNRAGRALDVADAELEAFYDFQDPIHYAASPERQGTRVININFASSLDDRFERQAIADATNGGVLVVASAGNTGQNQALFPAAYDCVLGVGAVDRNAQRASFSTYGLGVDIVAPGVAVYGPDVSGEKGYSQGDYASASGTSFAAPHASGVAALLFSARPDLSAWDVLEIIMRSARDLGKPGFDPEYGYGLLDAGAALELAKVWRAHSAAAPDYCTGDRYRVYGSLYFDANQNGQRDADEVAAAEPYTATTNYVELYAQNGARRLAVTYPNHAGIFTFDVTYAAKDAPYTIKLRNATRHQPLFFANGMAGPYDIDMTAMTANAVVINGALFIDSNNDGLAGSDETFAALGTQVQATVALYAANGQEPLATAVSDPAGNFLFFLAPPTTTVTYELRASGGATVPPTAAPVIVTVAPGATHIAATVGLDSSALIIGGQDQSPNPTPVALQVITHTGSIVLHWTTPQPLRNDSVIEVAYARQPSGPYQPLGMTALAQTSSYTIFDLPGLPTGGDYYFVVRARTQDPAQSAFWSGYSNEATLRTAPAKLLFLPLAMR